MSRVLVSILSNHTLPNYLFIKEMDGHYDELLFITSPEIERNGRDSQLEKALKLPPETVVFISVDNDEYLKILDTLSNQWEIREGDQYIVNLTGGTKIMSLATHDYFAKHNASFYYVPIEKNSYNNLDTGEWYTFSHSISLKDYFTLYGIQYTQGEGLFKPAEYTFSLFNQVKQRDYNLTYEMYHAHDEYSSLSRQERCYFGGEWFEEYVYLRLKKELKLRDEDIAMSLRISRGIPTDSTNDNELDVAFIYNNILHVIECKVTMTGYKVKQPQENIEKYLYKLAAVSKDYGLSVKPYLFTLHKIKRLNEATQANLAKRCKILGICKIVGPEELSLKEIFTSNHNK